MMTLCTLKLVRYSANSSFYLVSWVYLIEGIRGLSDGTIRRYLYITYIFNLYYWYLCCAAEYFLPTYYR